MNNNTMKNTAGILALCLVATGAGFYFWKWLLKYKSVKLEKVEGDTEVGANNPPINYSFTGTVPSSAHFKADEFNSKDGKQVPTQYFGNLQTLMNQLEVIRAALGNVPLNINSGYRSPEHNKEVGGRSGSQHLVAKASDIYTGKHTPAQIKQVIEKLIADKKIIEGGIGLYPTFVHYDIRGTKARW